VAVTWSESGLGGQPAEWPGGTTGLRLVEAGDRPGDRRHRRSAPAGVRPTRLPLEVRRRRTLLAAMAVLLVALALPLSGTGGHSHPAGSTLAETGRPVVYTVQPGDTLWSIAARVDPSADPRPLVATLASQTGSDTVVPGERIVLP
jgi:nucleoid-associated protein YgaU